MQTSRGARARERDRDQSRRRSKNTAIGRRDSKPRLHGRDGCSPAHGAVRNAAWSTWRWSADEFRDDQEVAIWDVQNAVTLLCDAALEGDEYVPNLVELSQQAAEAVAKSIVAGHGLTPTATHELNELATQLENAYRGRRGGEERRRFAQAIRALNGNTRAAHGARYARACGSSRRSTRWSGFSVSSDFRLAGSVPVPSSIPTCGRPAGGSRPVESKRAAKRLERREGFDRDRARCPSRNAPLGRGGRVDREGVGRRVNEIASSLPRMARLVTSARRRLDPPSTSHRIRSFSE